MRTPSESTNVDLTRDDHGAAGTIRQGWAHKKKKGPRRSEAVSTGRLDKLIEEATVDCYNDSDPTKFVKPCAELGARRPPEIRLEALVERGMHGGGQPPA